MNSSLPGYLLTMTHSGDYLGGMMICDHFGIPKDFKYTDPITPNKIQRIIYGSVLDKYIRNHVLFGALVKEINAKPSFIVVPTLQLEELDQDSNYPFLSLQRTQMQPIGDKGHTVRSKEREILIQGWLDASPVRVVFGEIPPEQQDPLIQDLISLSKTMDIAEPMERLERALKAVCLEQED